MSIFKTETVKGVEYIHTKPNIQCRKLKVIFDTISQIDTIEKFEEKLKEVFNGECGDIGVTATLKEEIKKYCEVCDYEITCRDGVRDGCYGSSSGEIYDGLTLFLDLNDFEEYVDTSYPTTFVNPLHEIDNHGGKFLDWTEDQIEAAKDAYEVAGYTLKGDNTYNHENENCDFMCELNLDFVQKENESLPIVFVKFHCGGDPRGNYTRLYAIKFKDIDDMYCAFMPYREALEEQDSAV